jgi:phosphatidylglycerol:prolipoprotein diacylglycerol transferase
MPKKKRKSSRTPRPQNRPQQAEKIRGASPGRVDRQGHPEPTDSADTSQVLAAEPSGRLVTRRKLATGSLPRVETAVSPTPVDASPTADEPAFYGVAPTYWLERSGADTPAGVRFVGTAADGERPARRFERVAPFPELPSHVGRTSLSVLVRGLPAGRWHVQAQALDEHGQSVGAVQREDLSSRLYPLLRGPGVRPFAWPALVLLGVVLAIVTQMLLVRAEGLDARAAGLSAVAAAIVGFVSAKAGFIVWHRVPPSGFATAGTMIQFFLVGAFGSLMGFAWLVDLPVLRLLDLTTPGVFAAMALARPGCWLGGCCAGRPTTSRWGMWSSDRSVGVRRVPVQLLESALAAVIALLSLVLVLAVDERSYGLVLVLSASLYTLGRQLLFPLRAEARRSPRRRPLVGAVAAVIATVSVALLAAFASSASPTS